MALVVLIFIDTSGSMIAAGMMAAGVGIGTQRSSVGPALPAVSGGAVRHWSVNVSFPVAFPVLRWRVSAVYGLAHAFLRGVRWGGCVASPRAAACTVSTILSLPLILSACAVGPNYKPAAAPVPIKFKELKGWKLARPSDALDRGDWWSLYHDKHLDFLMRQVEVSNQTVAAQAAAYEEARAVIREAQAALFPTLTASYTYTRMRTGPNAAGGGLSGAATGSAAAAAGHGIYTTTFVPQLSGSWDLDVWGKVRRQIEANTSAAQASAADLANVKLSEQAMLATAYFNMRAMDALHDLLTRTIAEYKKTYDVVNNQYKAGYGPSTGTTGGITQGDVAAAMAQILTTQGQLLNADMQRAQYEHAVAMLTGRPPAELTIAHFPLSGTTPRIPVTVPSTLLERRPDIADAERTMQQENALIGVAEAAFYPDISLSGMLEWVGKNPLPFNVANEVWSLGAAASEPIFEGGLLSAQLDAARAVYWQSVANYRQTVLTAFQGVEDELAAVHFLARQLAVEEEAARQQRIAVNVYENQLNSGIISYTTVATAQILLLSDEEAALTARQNLFLASVTLIEDLGGTWDTTLLPTQKELQQSFSIFPQLPTQ
jgi:NodT family efflux transporter outer membrane factor (OMF) lipoprotein